MGIYHMKFTGNESKETLLYKGIELIEKFSEVNGLRIPKIHTVYGSTGFYGIIYPKGKNEIHINMTACRPAVKTPGYDWTFPGYIQDLTPYGILAHEFGHYISDVLGKQFRKNFFNMKRIEPDVTSSDSRGLDERMAEAARLFITNPDLLKKGRPVRYNLLREHYEPIVKKKWSTVLVNAHPKIHTATERWIERGNLKNKNI